MFDIDAAKVPTFAIPSFLGSTNLFVSMENEALKLTSKCPIRTTTELVGGKWKLLILFQLAPQPLRLSELKRIIPDISEKMLIQELKTLSDNNLVRRKNFGEVPPRVEYELTAIGHKVMPLIAEMRNFAVEYENELKLTSKS
jgi:DNA-binding HxlR family transcriptional regulator